MAERYSIRSVPWPDGKPRYWSSRSWAWALVERPAEAGEWHLQGARDMLALIRANGVSGAQGASVVDSEGKPAPEASADNRAEVERLQGLVVQLWTSLESASAALDLVQDIGGLLERALEREVTLLRQRDEAREGLEKLRAVARAYRDARQSVPVTWHQFHHHQAVLKELNALLTPESKR